MSTALFDPIKTMSKITDSVIVGFSGGKESVVLLDLCHKYFKRVYPYFLFIHPDLQFQQRMLSWYERRYGQEILRLPHMDVSEYFHYGSFRDGYYEYPLIDINDIYSYLRVKYDTYWIAGGERMDDSLWRRGMIHNSSSIDQKRGRFYPLAMWKRKECLDYIKYHKLYYSQDQREKKKGSFGSLHGENLYIIREYYPEDYERILQLYPFAGAGVKRYEEYLLKGENKDGKK